MCGIVGYVGSGNVVPGLVACLKRLEYRGYDSAGVGVVRGSTLRAAKGVGPIEASERKFRALSGPIAVGHTRWATHGPPSERNAHPHLDCKGRIAVVHNGIIENYEPLRAGLLSRGHKFRSETDTEVVPHLLEEAYRGDLEAAVRSVVGKLEGSFALAVVAAGSPFLVAARRDAPLMVGVGTGEALVASDAPALLPRTRRLMPLEDREIAVLGKGRVSLSKFDGTPVRRRPERTAWRLEDAERAGYDHFMLKEIFEQPLALRETLAGKLGDMEEGRDPAVGVDPSLFDGVTRVLLAGCGTSFHAALLGKLLVERFAHIPAEAVIASELRHEAHAVGPGDLLVAISQSGETADTLAAAREAQGRGARLIALCNTVGSTLAREAQGVLYTHAGPEISVAATKTFTTQVAALALLALHIGRLRSALAPGAVASAARELGQLPGLVQDLLDRRAALLPMARRLSRAPLLFLLGRGLGHPVALEGALKLKEIAYLPSEGYPAGELKHGTLALVEKSTPVVGLALPGVTYAKLLSNLKEVKARGAPVLALALDSDREVAGTADATLALPDAPEFSAALLAAVALQLLAYDAARLRGCPIDRPRNLAKSVTVE